MEIGVTLFVVAVLVLFIWVFIELKRFKHKIFAMVLIALILFSYLSFSVVLRNEDINYKSIEGLTKATKIYFSWLGTVFGNLKSVTSYAVKQDWKTVDESNKTSTKN